MSNWTRMVIAFACKAIEPEFGSRLDQTKEFKIMVFTASFLALSINDCVKTYLSYRS